MSEQDSAKRGQGSDMKQKSTARENSVSREQAVQSPVPPAPARASDGMLEPDQQAHIGRRLRAAFDEIVNEGVPDRFRRLLDDLERDKADGS